MEDEDFRVDRALFGTEHTLHLRDVTVAEDLTQVAVRRDNLAVRVVMTLCAVCVVVIVIMGWAAFNIVFH